MATYPTSPGEFKPTPPRFNYSEEKHALTVIFNEQKAITLTAKCQRESTDSKKIWKKIIVQTSQGSKKIWVNIEELREKILIEKHEIKGKNLEKMLELKIGNNLNSQVQVAIFKYFDPQIEESNAIRLVSLINTNFYRLITAVGNEVGNCTQIKIADRKILILRADRGVVLYVNTAKKLMRGARRVIEYFRLGNIVDLLTVAKFTSSRNCKVGENERRVLQKLRGVEGIIQIHAWGYYTKMRGKIACEKSVVMRPESQSLKDALKDIPFEARPSIAIGILEAVHRMHNAGIVHRNLSSETILMVQNKPQLTGFSSAMDFTESDESPEVIVEAMKQDTLEAGRLVYELLFGDKTLQPKVPTSEFVDLILKLSPDKTDSEGGVIYKLFEGGIHCGEAAKRLRALEY